MITKHIGEGGVVSHWRGARREVEVLLERTCRGNDGIALHLKSVQREWDIGVIRAVAERRVVLVVKSIFMEI